MQTDLHQRSWLKSSTAILASAVAVGINGRGTLPAAENGLRRGTGGNNFRHRGYLGWITDLATEPDPQSADQGRCRCQQCKAHTDAEYHALLNTRVGDYIRSRWPDKTIGVNSWGMRFGDPARLPSLMKISQGADYLIDVNDSSSGGGGDYRRRLIRSLDCDFGTLGGPQVEPPQHWKRDRWFLPTAKRSGEHLRQLGADGGAACEYFFHILANPGDELTFWVAGKTLSDPATAWQEHLADCVEELYGATQASLRDGLVEVFVKAEDAYFRHLPTNTCGTISLEPLVSSRPGPAAYLRDRLNTQQRAQYARELRTLEAEARKISLALPQNTRMRKVVRCLKNVLIDLDGHGQAGPSDT
jgi:hypothetical protein